MEASPNMTSGATRSMLRAGVDFWAFIKQNLFGFTKTIIVYSKERQTYFSSKLHLFTGWKALERRGESRWLDLEECVWDEPKVSWDPQKWFPLLLRMLINKLFFASSKVTKSAAEVLQGAGYCCTFRGEILVQSSICIIIMSFQHSSTLLLSLIFI